MKRTISLLLTVIMLAVIGIPAYAADYKCELVASETKVNAGDTVSIDVKISDGLSGINVIINYDIDKFELIDSESSDRMWVVGNTSEQGKINLVAVSEDVQPAQDIFSFKLRVLADGGKITMKVKEALAEGTADVSSSVVTNELKIKANGNAERLTPITTAAQSTTDNSAVPTQQNSAENGENVTPSNSNGENVTVTDTDTQTEPVTELDADGNPVTEEEFQKQSNIGLTVAICIGVIALAAVIAIVIKKRADMKAQDIDVSDEK